ncbi:MAG: 50S ribosomal protein L3 [Actinomycetota bacterium]|jgi:large subunit ribosomal protein L3|nr:50S ribosomal protein L3 [Actinomycetota bacterium]
MVDAIYGKKIGTTQVFKDNGNAVYVTAIEAEPCVVLQVKDKEKDGYHALKVAFGKVDKKKVNKPKQGEFSKLKAEPKRYTQEIRLQEAVDIKAGDSIDPDAVFKVGDKLKIRGTSKGKGFAGVIKRHNFHRGRMSHGSHSHRIPGSVGMCATPARIHKGKKMPGRMGNATVTIKGSEVVEILAEQNLILVKGSVPGSKGNIVYLEKQN